MAKKIKTATGIQIEKKRNCDWCMVVITAFILLALAIGVFFLIGRMKKAEATVQSPCEVFCADWNRSHTICEDWDYRLCHVNPSHSNTLEFNNLTSCNNHLGTPHSNGTYDLHGVCPEVTPTSTPTVTPTATPTETPTPTPTPDDKCVECEPTVTPTPTPTPEVRSVCTSNCGSPPTFAGSSTEPPKCGVGDVTKPVENPHAYRSGGDAILRWWNTAGDQVIIFYKQVTSPDWQYSVKLPNTGYAEIHDLGSMDISFAIMQVDSCSGGVTADVHIIVDGASRKWVLFR